MEVAIKKANGGMRPNLMAMQSYDGMHLIYEAVCAYRAGGRRGTHKIKNRSEVSGGTKKLCTPTMRSAASTMHTDAPPCVTTTTAVVENGNNSGTAVTLIPTAASGSTATSFRALSVISVLTWPLIRRNLVARIRGGDGCPEVRDERPVGRHESRLQPLDARRDVGARREHQDRHVFTARQAPQARIPRPEGP